MNGIESGKDDSDAESDKLGSGNEFGKSNKNENSRQGKKFINLTANENFLSLVFSKNIYIEIILY